VLTQEGALRNDSSSSERLFLGFSLTRVQGLKLPVYEALSHWCMRPEAPSAWGLMLLVYEALRY
jgi:hypothetical protein